MAKIDFNDILKTQVVGSAPEPKQLPSGTYVGTISGLPRVVSRDTKAGERGVVIIPIALTEAMTDVSETELAAAGGLRLPNGEPHKVNAEFWNDAESTSGWSYQLDRFLAGFGVTIAEGQTYADAFETIQNMDVTSVLELEEFQRKDGSSGSKAVVKRVFAGAPS